MPLQNDFKIGKRICIIGPSGSGKSTLAYKIGQQKSLPVLHLDQIAHIPHFRWVRCEMDDFKQKYTNFILRDSWVIEGNYTALMNVRIERADTVIFRLFQIFQSFDKRRVGRAEL